MFSQVEQLKQTLEDANVGELSAHMKGNDKLGGLFVYYSTMQCVLSMAYFCILISVVIALCT